MVMTIRLSETGGMLRAIAEKVIAVKGVYTCTLDGQRVRVVPDQAHEDGPAGDAEGRDGE